MDSWAWSRGWTLGAQNSTRFLTEIADVPNRKAFKVRPDLLFSERGRPVAIADAKWKHPKLSARGFVMPDQGDLYQLHAYASVFGCDQLALVYPWADTLAKARETIFELPPAGCLRPKVTVLCLDVANDDLPMRVRGGGW